MGQYHLKRAFSYANIHQLARSQGQNNACRPLSAARLPSGEREGGLTDGVSKRRFKTLNHFLRRGQQ
jgi:hypothetical protein